jgi:hypothetical protein
MSPAASSEPTLRHSNFNAVGNPLPMQYMRQNYPNPPSINSKY